MGNKYSTKNVSQEGRTQAPNISSTPRDFHKVSMSNKDNNGITCEIKFTTKKGRG